MPRVEDAYEQLDQWRRKFWDALERAAAAAGCEPGIAVRAAERATTDAGPCEQAVLEVVEAIEKLRDDRLVSRVLDGDPARAERALRKRLEAEGKLR